MRLLSSLTRRQSGPVGRATSDDPPPYLSGWRVRRAAAVVTVALGLATVTATPALAANLAVNPGFEDGLTGWTCSAAAQAQTVSSPVHGGTKALRATPAGADFARCQQTVTVKPGSTYQLSAWVQGSYVFLGASGTGVNASTWGMPGSTWNQLKTSFTAPAGTSSVTIHLNGWYGQTAYTADDVALDGDPGDGDTTPPSVPGNVAVGAATNSSLSVSWSPSTDNVGVTRYEVSRDGAAPVTVTGTTYVATGLTPSTTYKFKVRACDAANNCSAYSAESSGTTEPGDRDTIPPTVPGDLAVSGPTSSSLKLTWAPSTDNVGVTRYEISRDGGTPARSAVPSYTATGLSPKTTYKFKVRACDAAENCSPYSAEASGTTTEGGGGELPKRVMVGYLHASFANGSGYIRMADVPNEWDVINLAFGEPTSVTSGDIRFRQCPVAECANVEPEADFIAAIKAKQAQGKKVLISIGGQNGQVQLTSTGARDKFVESVSAIIDRYGLDGLDIDFEGHSLYLNQGDTNLSNPTTPVIVNLISALKTLKSRYGAKFVLTMAPETFFVQLGYQFYGPGPNGAADRRAASYLPVIHAMRNDLTLLHVQDYNSGPIMGLDNQYHTMGGHDFHIAMTDMLLAGFPIMGNQNNVFPALRQDQVAIGLPASPQAGNGFTTVGEVQKAFDCLAKGTNCGSYKPRGVYPNLRGLMTWSINWDRYNAFEFSKNHRAYLNALG
ncbi:chitinase [Nonomuraea sp. NN258]|uniref:glycoside hydrolase family 18 protein n=1 Tax=Nonomuraea antri TaxID=2730852 RepID=UPI00156847D3|nr:glycoside hydrolase family 18 protein [Nonomuraea antri]NRQ39779.1 chitinase [Nonomuraea antri]